LEKRIGFEQYVENMKEGQEDIFFLGGENTETLLNSPLLEGLKKRGYDVLLMTEPIDEYAVQQLKEFEGKKLISATKEGLDFEMTEDEKKETEDEKASYESFCTKIKEILGDKVEKVVVGSRIIDSPCCLVTGEFGWSANMERIMKAQALRDSTMSTYMTSKKTMEINTKHPIISELKKKFESDASDKTVKDLVWLLFETSLLTSGFSLDDPAVFSGRIHKLIKLGLSIFDDGEVSEDDEDVPDLEDAEDADNTMEEVD